MVDEKELKELVVLWRERSENYPYETDSGTCALELEALMAAQPEPVREEGLAPAGTIGHPGDHFVSWEWAQESRYSHLKWVHLN